MRVLSMAKEGMKTGQIAEALTADGYKISQPTVSRWIKAHKQKAQGAADRLFQEHVEWELPKDLDALEGMEAQLLHWAGEDPATRAKRLRNPS